MSRPQRPKTRRRPRVMRAVYQKMDRAERRSCPTGKTAYRSYAAAERAMLRAQAERDPGDDVPRRVYECPDCSKFHLSKIEHWKER